MNPLLRDIHEGNTAHSLHCPTWTQSKSTHLEFFRTESFTMLRLRSNSVMEGLEFTAETRSSQHLSDKQQPANLNEEYLIDR